MSKNVIYPYKYTPVYYTKQLLTIYFICKRIMSILFDRTEKTVYVPSHNTITWPVSIEFQFSISSLSSLLGHCLMSSDMILKY